MVSRIPSRDPNGTAKRDRPGRKLKLGLGFSSSAPKEERGKSTLFRENATSQSNSASTGNPISEAQALLVIAGCEKLRRLPHVSSCVLELPFRSDADMVVEEDPDCCHFVVETEGISDVRAHTIEIHPRRDKDRGEGRRFGGAPARPARV
ncbi:hypothetical protein ACSQ67_013962 [Phaseolus vulgaris]